MKTVLVAAISVIIFPLNMYYSEALAVEPEASESAIPIVDFKIAAQRLDRKETDNAFFLFRLRCGLGSCSLEMIEMNDCRSEDGVTSFVPKFQQWTTSSKNLQVTPRGAGELQVSASQASHFPRAMFTFTYVPSKTGAERLTSSSGRGILDDRVFPKAVETFSVAPVAGDKVAIPLACPMLIRGIPK